MNKSFDKEKIIIKKILGTFLIFGLVVLLFLSFNYPIEKNCYIESTESDYSVWVIAEYSDGEDSWEYEVSDLRNVYFINGKVVKSTCTSKDIRNGYCVAPPHIKVDETKYEFNRYKEQEKWEMVVDYYSKDILVTTPIRTHKDYLTITNRIGTNMIIIFNYWDDIIGTKTY